MKYILYLLFYLVFSSTLFGQTIKKGKIKVVDESLSFWYVEPEKNVKGVLVLLPGLGEDPSKIFEKTSLPKHLLEVGFVTVVPKINDKLFGDESTFNQIIGLFDFQAKRFQSDILDYYIGGLSAGGAIAITYTEKMLATGGQSNLKGVFAIDPPLDLIRFYESAERKIGYDCANELIRKEGNGIKERLEAVLGGTPEQQPINYVKYSVFSSNLEDGGNAKILMDFPIRLYSAPDLEYVKETYCDELQFSDINAHDLNLFYQFLKSNGNSQVEYITTEGRGFHSWNIMDAKDCAEWIESISKESML